MKKLISIILSAALSISLSVPAAMAAEGADAQQLQEALENVKERINVPEEYSEFSSSTSETDGKAGYRFTWRTKDDGRSISVYTTDNIITSYWKHSDDYGKGPYISGLGIEEAKKSASEFFEEVNGNYPYEIELEGSSADLHSSVYSFGIKVYINGIACDGQCGHIDVNRKTGETESFNIWYDDIEEPQFKSPADTIGTERAKEEYGKQLGLKLVYRIGFDEDKEEKFAYPVYVPKYEYNKYINALTGEVYEPAADMNDYGVAENMSMAAADAVAGGSAKRELTVQELDEIEKIDGLVSKADAEKLLRENKTLNIPKSVKTERINLSKSYRGEKYTYSLQMSGEKENIYASINAKTGEIISYSRYTYTSSDSPKTENKNDKAFEVLAGDKAKEYKYDEENNRYVRYVNDTEVADDTAYITYTDGVLTGYSISYTDTQFPSVADVMSVSEAEKAMFAAVDYELACVINGKKAVPVYMHENVSINPFTGVRVDYNNEEITSSKDELVYSDIDGHYAKNYIEALAQYGVGFEGGMYMPDETITQKDFLALLMAVYRSGITVMRNNPEQAKYVYDDVIGKGIITEEERDDDAYVTRESAAVYMIRAMGAEEYARYNDIYVTPFDDVTENKGYIALLSAMGVVNGDDGHFNPTREITRAESAAMIYNYLTR